MVYCKKCAKRHFCKKVEKTRHIDCTMFKEDLDFLQDSDEEMVKWLEKQEKEEKLKPIPKKRKGMIINS